MHLERQHRVTMVLRCWFAVGPYLSNCQSTT